MENFFAHSKRLFVTNEEKNKNSLSAYAGAKVSEDALYRGARVEAEVRNSQKRAVRKAVKVSTYFC